MTNGTKLNGHRSASVSKSHPELHHQLLQGNREWSKRMQLENPGLFTELA